MPLVTVTVLQYKPQHWYRAFANMGRWLMRPFVAEGLTFQKMLGSGQHYGLVPDLSRYVFLGVWDSEQQARQFFQSNDWQQHSRQTAQTGTLWLVPLKSHGLWDGQNPFTCSELSSQPVSELIGQPVSELTSQPVAVLTRATIRSSKLLDFWRHVPQARQRLQAQGDNLLFGIGVGEKPVVQQCTISVWRNASAIDGFAYRQSGHKEVVKLTRQRNWYAEELFARFAVLRAEGEVFAGIS